MFEMTCAANATGCTPMQNHMTGPEANLDTVSEIFKLKCDGDIIEFPGSMDYVQRNTMAGGVFVAVRVDDGRTCDLQIGEHLDDIGGFTSHTDFERADITCELDASPVGLAPNAKIYRLIKVDEIITWDDVLLDEDQLSLSSVVN